MRKICFFILIISALRVEAQVVKKNHFILGTGIAFSGNNNANQSGFAYDVAANLSIEFNFFERTSAGIKGGISSKETISGNSASTYNAGPFIRQYLLGGLNIQAAYLLKKEKSNLFQGILAYSFYAGKSFIIEPYLEYGNELINKVNDDYVAFGLGFRFILTKKPGN